MSNPNPNPNPNPVKIAVTTVGGEPPLTGPTAFQTGQMAYDQVNKVLYVPTGLPNEVATGLDTVGTDGNYVTINTTQTITGTKTIDAPILNGGTLNAATLIGCDIQDPDLTGGTISVSNLMGCTVADPDITMGTMTGTALMGCGVADPDITMGTMTGTNLMGCAVNDPDLTGGTITDTSLTGVSSTSNFDMMTNTIVNLADPLNPQDAATKSYVDSVGGGDVTLATAQTITGQKTFTQGIIGNLLGNANTATEWSSTVTVNAEGDVNGFFPINGAADSISYVTTLATVNSDLMPSTLITANAKGLVTSATQAGLGNLSDVVDTVDDATIGQALVWNGTQYENQTIGSSLTAGSGITITSDAINSNVDNNLVVVNGSNQLTLDLANLQTALTGNTPSFFAQLSSPSSTISDTYSGVVQCDQVMWDTTEAYDAGTYTYTPQTPGYYQVNLFTNVSSGTVLEDFYANLYMNGSPYLQGSETAGTAQTIGGSMLSTLVPFNGTTDNIQPGTFAQGTFGGGLAFNIVQFSATLVAPFNSISAASPMFAGYNSSVPTITSGTPFILPIDTVQWDTAEGFNTSTHAYIVTLPGFYQVNVSAPVEGGVITEYVTAIQQNGGTVVEGSAVAGGTGNNAISTVSAILQCALGDSITVLGLCFGTGSLSVGAGNVLSIGFLSGN